VLEFDWQPQTMPYDNRQRWELKTISNIARDMGQIRGEKNLVWIGGFSSGGRGAGGAPSTDYYQDMARVMEELSEARVTFYPVRPSMVKPFELDNFAELTGGRVYWEDKDLAGLLREAIDDTREAYMLTYVPSNYKKDGAPHEVKVKTGRKGIDLRYRPAYVAEGR
jgi:VWFA-related protein